jgi:hypothetical protein
MSVENDGISLSWEEIKAASKRLLGRGPVEELQDEKRMVREYLAHEECEDARVKEHIAIPGYN